MTRVVAHYNAGGPGGEAKTLQWVPDPADKNRPDSQLIRRALDALDIPDNAHGLRANVERRDLAGGQF